VVTGTVTATSENEERGGGGGSVQTKWNYHRKWQTRVAGGVNARMRPSTSTCSYVSSPNVQGNRPGGWGVCLPRPSIRPFARRRNVRERSGNTQHPRRVGVCSPTVGKPNAECRARFVWGGGVVRAVGSRLWFSSSASQVWAGPGGVQARAPPFRIV